MVTSTNLEAGVIGDAGHTVYAADANFAKQPVTRSTPLPVYDSLNIGSTYFSGVDGFTPAATATDFMALQPIVYGRTAFLDSITISGTATAASNVTIRLQRSANGGGGTSSALTVGKADQSDADASTNVYSYTANRSSGGDGIDGTRQLIHTFKLNLGAAGGANAQAYKITFFGAKRPRLKDLYEWFVLNWNGQAVPAGTSLNITWEWSEYGLPNIVFAGDSTTSNANFLFTTLGSQGELNTLANVRNCGSNGYKLSDFILNNAIPYPAFGSLSCCSRVGGGPPKMPGVMVISFGINDIRQGAVTRNELISMIDAAIYGVINGTTSGQTYTSPKGAGTTFTWAASQTAQPDTKIILWGPNSFTSDDPGATGYVTLTGRFSGMTLDQAAQQASDDLFMAYQYFADSNDPRVYRVVQKQEVTGRQCLPNATNGLMADILHPNEKGQNRLARQIYPHLLDAIHAARCDTF